MEGKTPNALISETSPYLLQHAYNPVAWMPWGEAALQRAVRENKPLLISIGYAACHWCHVMERECFEDPEVAEVMNTRFIPVKVDREERPDVDQIYMDALQVMTGSGGWPLNVVALPDGRPFWGATYVPREKWISALVQLDRLFRNEGQKVADYAENLTDAVRKINLPEPETGTGLPTLQAMETWVGQWSRRFDPEYGGSQGAPKFMMPVTLRFLMHWGQEQEDQGVSQHVRNTLTRMAHGGLYDPVGGGFARYSVDARWHVPHFEKMLYDNAQLLGLYAQGYARFGDAQYRQVVRGTIDFIYAELTCPQGGYYASLDADSLDPEGNLTEGAYYRWREAELREILGEDFDWFSQVFHIDAFGHWEDGYYVLIRTDTNPEAAQALGMETEAFEQRLETALKALASHRSKRPRPRLDNKVLVSWNGLLLTGLADAYRYCGFPDALEAAVSLGEFLYGLMEPEGRLPHGCASGSPKGNGFLEDYAAVMEGFLHLYTVTLDICWMERAKTLLSYVMDHFSESGQAQFYFNSDQDPELIRRSVETADNVIPASNSTVAHALVQLGVFYGETAWIRRAEAMLGSVVPSMERYSGQYANWMRLGLLRARPLREIAICGTQARGLLAEIGNRYLPQVLLAGAEGPSEAPLFQGRFDPGQTRIYVCEEGSCKQPVATVSEALDALA
ncbi:thioredoxin domain-containing protein [Robiginitalea sediminis]|uniref:thioredoxin domain-containing protein n=1 Tax=Robiginitalea sediminis TaxID=1982593 RepID=UPI000B4B6947|nr:thioredoxin domain-containing protein [Robiginitalea sediminis]